MHTPKQDHNPYFLSKGAHGSPDEGRCAMEWVSYLAGEPHSDAPGCVSPVLQSFGITLNDQWDDKQRQKLRPYLARCIGTAGDGRDEERAWLCTDWLVREFCPAFLELVPSLVKTAARLRMLPPIVGVEEAGHCMAPVNAARIAARATAGDAARAAGIAAGVGARIAAGDAARIAAQEATGVAARVVARIAARETARVAAGEAAREAAWDAARIAARAAAWDALEVTVVKLQASALRLFDRMLPTEVIQPPVAEDAEMVCGVRVR